MAAQLQEQQYGSAPLQLGLPKAFQFAHRAAHPLREPFSWARSAGLAAVMATHGGLLIALSLPPTLPLRSQRDQPDVSGATASWADVPAASIDAFLTAPPNELGGEEPLIDDPRDGDAYQPPRKPPVAAGSTKATNRAEDVQAAPTATPTGELTPTRRDTAAPIGQRSALDAPHSVPPPGGLAEEFQPLTDDLGKARLSDAALAAADAPNDSPMAFRTPGSGSEEDVFYRPPPLEYKETMFEKAWQPSEGLFDELSGKLARAVTKQITIPLNPRFNLVCNVTLLGVGSCNIVRNAGSQVIVERPDPPPWESTNRAQCAELRDRLAAATTADEIAFVLDRLQALCVGTPAQSAGNARRP